MSRLLIVANRLPVTVERRKGENRFRRSVGGVATGLDSCRRGDETLWIGWAETPVSRIDSAEREVLREQLRSQHGSEPVFLTQDDVAGFYHGFSNRTLWPLFHYFSRYAEFNPDFWRTYERVNRKYRDAVLEAYEPGDRIWVHDYQLMLLPGMLRQKLPDAPIGFFLHIPFPSHEKFRLLPWRRELLEGVLGASLIGFHTHDYVRHFLGSVHSLLGLDDRNGQLRINDRLVLVDAFPMGIDYHRYSLGAKSRGAIKERKSVVSDERRIVLSIDRLDYTKGIPERLQAFDEFLETYPEWRGKVTLVCVAVPSRSRVWTYRELKRRVDELVGAINGRWGTIDWTPVQYLYRSLPFNLLVGLYSAADVALVTPLRDGMNLIAKEYVAAHSGRPGVLVLSEMAGAARELNDALIVNPHDRGAVVSAIHEALTMPVEEQTQRNLAMQSRLQRYNVGRWADDFLGRVDEVMMHQLAFDEYVLTEEARERLLTAFATAEKRLLLLDYDGTLVSFASTPEAAKPDAELLQLLSDSCNDGERTSVVLISGRDRHTLEDWFGNLNVTMAAEHGAWVREPGEEWATTSPLNTEWKDQIRPVIEQYVDRTPGSSAEEKDFSLAWHYRRVSADLARRRTAEITENLAPLAQALGLSLLDGDRVLEVKPASIDKGSVGHRWMGRSEFDFVLAIGDDVTDEDMFCAAPPHAWTLKVGRGPTSPTFDVADPSLVRALLREMVGICDGSQEPKGTRKTD
jgi:trehalose 6-phosphate synthase/phosphatase